MQKILNWVVVLGFVVSSAMSYYAVSRDKHQDYKKERDELKSELKQAIALKVSILEWQYKNRNFENRLEKLEEPI